MYIRISMIAHYLIILLSLLFVAYPFINAGMNGVDDIWEYSFSFMSGVWFIPIIAIALLITADIICSKMLNISKSFLLKDNFYRDECEEFHGFIKGNIRHGMSIKECEDILNSRNCERVANAGKSSGKIRPYSLMLSQSPLYYDKFNENHMGVQTVSFYIDWFTQKITFGIKLLRKAALLLQTIIMIAFFGMLCPVIELGLASISELEFLSTIISGAGFIGIAIYSWRAFTRDFFNNIEYTEKENFTYCKKCNRIVLPDRFLIVSSSVVAPNFSSPYTTSTTTYREGRIGSVTTVYSDGSEYTSGIYSDVPDTTTITAYGSRSQKKACPFCNEIYFDYHIEERCITVRH